MEKEPEERVRSGCFQWFIRKKKAVNKRWARARNAIRIRFGGATLRPDDIINETGNPDLIIETVGTTGANAETTPTVSKIDELDRVSITSSQISAIAEAAVAESLSKIFDDKEDNNVTVTEAKEAESPIKDTIVGEEHGTTPCSL